jgi:hypothetical protein
MDFPVHSLMRMLAFAGVVATLLLSVFFSGAAQQKQTATPAESTSKNLGYNLQVYSKAPPRLPATRDWVLQYQFTVPPLPSSPAWNYKMETVYQWGDVDFDEYGSNGKYKLSDYRFNQIVPQLVLGNVLDGNDPGYAPSWNQRDTWAVQAQYYWYKATTSTSYAQTGRIVKVNPGDEIRTTISYDAKTGTILASIADGRLSGSAGVSTITIARPFPSDPSLFASWREFFNKAVAASKTPYVMSTVAVDVETYNLDQATMCGLLPFTLRKISFPGVVSTPSNFATNPSNGFTCPNPLVKLDF